MVQIKMDPDNLSTRKNDVIYSEIDLDVSPSSSLDDSPSESEGISCDPHEAPFESPTIILQLGLMIGRVIFEGNPESYGEGEYLL
ncbi:hypothetical protein LR48_Vigan05g032300 [Vigna angularis]|uniref:Uncharacterized protein n=1 Tax=Phaseolus angularis TaxID=3914 RepID=A0A0L9UJH8_PHAAN|nr:hypothetical protein LR48_Vigan05g032300 [Vigna angularis]